MSLHRCRAQAATKPRFCPYRYGRQRPLAVAALEDKIVQRLRRTRRAIRILIDGTNPFATAKSDARLIKLLIRARRFNAALVGSDGLPFAALAKREGVSPSYFTRLVRLSYLAPDIIEAILDGRQPRDLTADKLLAHSRPPLDWHEQRTVLGLA
jgi:site-specific DNA recombinase